jgi:hypothetical protein
MSIKQYKGIRNGVCKKEKVKNETPGQAAML